MTSDTTTKATDAAGSGREVSEELLLQVRSEVSNDTLFHCANQFVVAGFFYPYIAAPCFWIYSAFRHGMPPVNFGDLVSFLFGGILGAAILGIVLGIIATVAGIISVAIVDLANRNFRFPLSIIACAMVISSVTIFLLFAAFGDARQKIIYDPGFWLIFVVPGTLLCQWIMIRTVKRQLPKEIYAHARKANVDPNELTEFLSRPTRWQFSLRDLILATVWIAVVLAALRALRLVGVQLEWYVLLSFLVQVPLCWLMIRFGESRLT